MSIEQFETYYWPQLESMMLQLVDAGITPVVYYEGIWDKRAEYLARLPKGKTIGYFQNSNMQLIKDTAGSAMCISGGMPNSLLRSGPASAIREKTHEICETLGKGGGFVMEHVRHGARGLRPRPRRGLVRRDQGVRRLLRRWLRATR